jgi:hypothetical protein
MRPIPATWSTYANDQDIQSIFLVLTGLALGAVGMYGAQSWSGDPQGVASSNCQKFDEPSFASGKGMTVSSHTTACSTLGTSVVSYVYVHPSEKEPTPEDLVFR